ncbi:hypothetical protein UFOVP816_11 [uncultured Caudovirales phage]|uniref:Uncharacterized protein n=1 Tax=uncultured Caudovirales phage TaxID=2100421 RepID=A0A6J5NZK3_9CAUD|nr:hypothetical protein UFOVP816_11 [uncultured Caudovirales phage]
MAYRENPWGQINAPTAGQIGEQIESIVAISSVALTSATPANITSISLTPGVWNVAGGVEFSNASGTATSTFCTIGTTSATLGTRGNNNWVGTNVVANQDGVAQCPPLRLTLAATTTVYLIGQMTISTGTITAGGRISGTRVG